MQWYECKQVYLIDFVGEKMYLIITSTKSGIMIVKYNLELFSKSVL